MVLLVYERVSRIFLSIEVWEVGGIKEQEVWVALNISLYPQEERKIYSAGVMIGK